MPLVYCLFRYEKSENFTEPLIFKMSSFRVIFEGFPILLQKWHYKTIMITQYFHHLGTSAHKKQGGRVIQDGRQQLSERNQSQEK